MGVDPLSKGSLPIARATVPTSPGIDPVGAGAICLWPAGGAARTGAVSRVIRATRDSLIR